MPVLIDAPQVARHDALVVGLVNNMPDAALDATERQFTSLLDRAAGERLVRLRLLAMPGVPRTAETRQRMTGRYASTETLAHAGVDALIVTGSEPRAASLPDEPFWPDLARLVDWAAGNTASTLWSCLSAHAAVLHLDGIARHRLASKRSGVFDCAPAIADHPLMNGTRGALDMPHSRWNDLREADLAAHGYEVVTRSPMAGVDLFVKRLGSLFVFFQGHPEYEPDTVAREYRRDIARYLRAERDDYPALPHGYFAAETEQAFLHLQSQALADRSALTLRDLPRSVTLRPGLEEGWQATVLPVFRNWLALVASARDAGRVAA